MTSIDKTSGSAPTPPPDKHGPSDAGKTTKPDLPLQELRKQVTEQSAKFAAKIFDNQYSRDAERELETRNKVSESGDDASKSSSGGNSSQGGSSPTSV